MLYGLLVAVLLLSLPACGWFRKNADQGCTDESCQQSAESMPMQVEEVDVTETITPDDVIEDISEDVSEDMDIK